MGVSRGWMRSRRAVEDGGQRGHTVPELIELVYRFYPRGARGGLPGQEDSAENHRLLDAKTRATADLGRFRAMLDRLTARLPGSSVFETLYMIPHGTEHRDACLQANLKLPTMPEEDGSHDLAILVSVLVPYYLLYSSLHFNIKGDRFGRAKHVRWSWSFTPMERPYVDEVAREIEATCGFERMPPRSAASRYPCSTPSRA